MVAISASDGKELWRTDRNIDVSRTFSFSSPLLIEVNGQVVDGRLGMDWSYSEAVHERRTIEDLAKGFERALRELIAHCRSGAGRARGARGDITHGRHFL